MSKRRTVVTKGWASPIRGANRWMLNVSVEWPSNLTDPKAADEAAERLARGVSALLMYAHRNNMANAGKGVIDRITPEQGEQRDFVADAERSARPRS
jgi:hypothetical protein